MELLIKTILFALFISSIVFFVALGRVKWRMHKKAKELGEYSDRWNDGYPPSHIPRSWVIEGIRLDPNDGHNIIPTWKFNGRYYSWLAGEE